MYHLQQSLSPSARCTIQCVNRASRQPEKSDNSRDYVFTGLFDGHQMFYLNKDHVKLLKDLNESAKCNVNYLFLLAAFQCCLYEVLCVYLQFLRIHHC